MASPSPFLKSFQVMIFWWIVIAAVYAFLMHLNPWGNWVFAMGGDKVSAPIGMEATSASCDTVWACT
mgnify:CR=1 FL=1